MTTKINPKDLNPELAKFLFDFFEYQATKENRTFWKRATPYQCPNGTYLTFVHDVVQRKRKNNDGVRYEFISDTRLGSGIYGEVREIAGTLAIDKDTYKYKEAGSHKDKTRAVKIQDTNKTLVSAVQNEFEISKQAGHLGVKEPVFTRLFGSFSVMKKLKGKELYNIINDDISYVNRLTTQQRLDLTKALLLALKNQVTDKNIIHRDIKPENIFVNLNSPITVTIFDYGLSIDKNKKDDQNPGSPSYAAPEGFYSLPQTEKSDVFSMGRILALIWCVDITSYYEMKPATLYLYNAENINLSILFTNITDLEDADKECIRSALQGMMHRSMEMRLGVNGAIEAFNKVKYPNKNIQMNENASPLKVESNNTIGSNSQVFFNKTPDENVHKRNLSTAGIGSDTCDNKREFK